ncbi:MAG: hypothetical protein H6827_01790 [Planctomycetes bacterium]|nr:hypothetical protein [Planctomycetota bacterium]
MVRMFCTVLFWFACGPLWAQASEPDARQVHWQRTLEDALELAQAQNRPILVAVNMDGESASDRIVHEEYRDPAFVAATRTSVCLVASVFRHNPRDYDDQGRRILCPRLGEVTCGEHIALEPLLFERFLSDGERVAPRHALILPSGEKAWDLSLSFDLHDIDKALVRSARDTQIGQPTEGLEGESGGPTSWLALAALRDNRGRARLEDALGRVQEEATLRTALDALAAKGDAGSIDALRIAVAHLAWVSEPVRAQVVATARALGLAQPLGVALRQRLAAPGPLPSVVDPAGSAVLLAVLAELDSATPATRSLLLACRALAEYGDGSGTEHRIALRTLLGNAESNLRAAGDSTLPVAGMISDAMPEAEELERRAAALEVELASHEDAALRARFAKTLLDLARRRRESGAGGADTLLADAEHYFGLALEVEPQHTEYWIERARTAYLRGRFTEEIEYGRRAFESVRDSPESALAIEALRWVGDGNARLLAKRSGADPTEELAGIREGMHALGAVAVSRFGDGTDWTSFASFFGALGLQREAIAVALCGAQRLPASVELRQTLNAALWQTGRIELAPQLAQAIAQRNAGSADAMWHAGYAWMLAAEDLRRREACAPALEAYANARARFEDASAANPEMALSCQSYKALAWLGAGLCHVRIGERTLAADCLVAAVSSHAELAGIRDGLGYDVLDLVDKLFEWRASGPSPVDPLALLDRLEAVAPGDPYWAIAVSDSELREALRADGRNPNRTERETVDAAGQPIRQMMGLPWEEGDAYLEASIAAARRAQPFVTEEPDRKPLAQSCTIRAERQLELGHLEGVQAALAEAAAVLGLAAPPPDASEAELRDLAKQLRAILGEARPRLRLGR